MIWLTVVVKQSPIHWFGGLTIYVEAIWRTTIGLRVGVLVMDRGGSDVALDDARGRSPLGSSMLVCNTNSVSRMVNNHVRFAGGTIRPLQIRSNGTVPGLPTTPAGITSLNCEFNYLSEQRYLFRVLRLLT